MAVEALVPSEPKRKYAAAERAAGATLPDRKPRMARAFAGVAIKKPKSRVVPAPGRLQTLIEQTVRVLPAHRNAGRRSHFSRGPQGLR